MLTHKLEQASKAAAKKRVIGMVTLAVIAVIVGLVLLSGSLYQDLTELRRGEPATAPIAEGPVSQFIQRDKPAPAQSIEEPVAPPSIERLETPAAEETRSEAVDEAQTREDSIEKLPTPATNDTPADAVGPKQNESQALTPEQTETVPTAPALSPRTTTPAAPSDGAMEVVEDPADRDAFKRALTSFETDPEPRILEPRFAQWRPERQRDILFLKDAAIDAFGAGDYRLAISELEKATALARQELQVRDEVFNQALLAARTARDADNHEAAKSQIDLALRLFPDSQEATALASEINALPKVIEHLRAAAVARTENNLKTELEHLNQILKLDSDRAGVAERKTSLQQDIRERAYAENIQAGLKAVDENQLKKAERHLSAARKLYPKRDETPLLQARVAALKSNLETERFIGMATALASSDDWDQSRELYRKATQIQPNNQQALDGLKLSISVVSLDRQITAHLNAPDRLAAANVAREAEQLVSKSVPIVAFSVSLDKKSKSLSDLLASYKIKVSVKVISDEQTLVSVRRVGKVGLVREKIIQLKPGTYTFEGKRAGYKSKLLRVAIPPGSLKFEVSIVCDERI